MIKTKKRKYFKTKSKKKYRGGSSLPIIERIKQSVQNGTWNDKIYYLKLDDDTFAQIEAKKKPKGEFEGEPTVQSLVVEQPRSPSVGLGKRRGKEHLIPVRILGKNNTSALYPITEPIPLIRLALPEINNKTALWVKIMSEYNDYPEPILIDINRLSEKIDDNVNNNSNENFMEQDHMGDEVVQKDQGTGEEVGQGNMVQTTNDEESEEDRHENYEENEEEENEGNNYSGEYKSPLVHKFFSEYSENSNIRPPKTQF